MQALINSYPKKEIIKLILEELLSNDCCFAEIRITYDINIDDFRSFITLFKGHFFRSVEIVLNYQNEHFQEEVIKSTKELIFVTKITFTNSPVYRKYDELKQWFLHGVFLLDGNTSDEKKSLPHIYPFYINKKVFLEAKNYNLFYFCKVYIDSNGNVFPYEGFENKINLKDKKLIEIIESPYFKNLWKVNKDEILVCKDCEHRYLCIDARIPELNNESKWHYNGNCQYNPYIAKWKGEENWLNVEQYKKENDINLN